MHKISKALAAIALITSCQTQAATQTFTLGAETYLNFDILKDLTYAQTVTETTSGTYSNFHIADEVEATTYFNAEFGTSYISAHGRRDYHFIGGQTWVDGYRGDNYTPLVDYLWFLGDAFEVGYIQLSTNALIQDEWGTFASSDTWAAGGSESQASISWLLVEDTLAPVPIPAAVWLMGSGLVGLLGFGRKKKAIAA